MSGWDIALAAACIALALLVAYWLTPVIRDFVGRRTPEGVAPRPVGYPIVAGATALGFGATALSFGRSAQLPAYLFLVALLVVLSFVDLATKTLPRPLVHTALVGGIVLLVPVGALAGEPQRLLWATLGAVGAYVALTVLHVVASGGFGFGDVRLGAVLGFYLAWQGLRYVPVGLFLAFVLSALTGLALIALGRAGRRTAIPFGPFLAVGAVLALVLGGPSLINA
jgi:leader peptidase (prepilin peptidase) / N-methyltransferase